MKTSSPPSNPQRGHPLLDLWRQAILIPIIKLIVKSDWVSYEIIYRWAKKKGFYLSPKDNSKK